MIKKQDLKTGLIQELDVYEHAGVLTIRSCWYTKGDKNRKVELYNIKKDLVYDLIGMLNEPKQLTPKKHDKD